MLRQHNIRISRFVTLWFNSQRIIPRTTAIVHTVDSFYHVDLHNVRVKIALVSLAGHKWIAREVDDIGLKFKVAIEAGANTRDHGSLYAPCAARRLFVRDDAK